MSFVHHSDSSIHDGSIMSLTSCMRICVQVERNVERCFTYICLVQTLSSVRRSNY